MAIELQIDQLSLEEKLEIMEALWQDLRRNTDQLPVPQWHKDLLDKREQMIETGESNFADWESAKKRIAERIS
jgi:putative addiction module component (TIGR02574 family)